MVRCLCWMHLRRQVYFQIDVQDMQIDVLCFTGSQGTFGVRREPEGILKEEGLQIRPLKSGGSGIQTYSKTHPVEMPSTALEAGT